MRYRPPEGATERARRLRRGATDAEQAMWRLLREAFPGGRFRRQVPIRDFIADFASHKAKLVIEIDGGQHRQEVDAARSALIEAEGYRILRFWNNDVLGNPDGIWRSIADALQGRVRELPPLNGEGRGGVEYVGEARPLFQTPPPPNPPPLRGRALEKGSSPELTFIASLRAIADNPAARGLIDDAAVLRVGDTNLVLTHDMIVEGVHFLSNDPPEDAAWKLVAVNLSDLAAKGARPLGVLLGFTLAGDSEWDGGFVRGLAEACAYFEAPLLGGDTVAAPGRTLGLTAIGETAHAPSRSGARDGDTLWVSGTIGDGAAGLRAARGEIDSPALLRRYRRPAPRLAAGQALVPLVNAMMDVSDGLLIDAFRMAEASGACLEIALDRLPLSDVVAALGQDCAARIAAATGGDDYELLFAAPARATARIGEIGAGLGLPLTAIGTVSSGTGLRLSDGGALVPLPDRLGYQHRRFT